MNWFSHVIVASGISRGCVRTTTTATVESRNMAAILQIIGWWRHAALFYRVLFWYMRSCYDQLTPMKSSYPPTSITWPYCGLKFIACRAQVFYLSWPLTKCWFSIGSRAHFKLTCWKQSRVAWKPVNSNAGLKVNQIITVSSLQMLCLQLLICIGNHTVSSSIWN